MYFSKYSKIDQLVCQLSPNVKQNSKSSSVMFNFVMLCGKTRSDDDNRTQIENVISISKRNDIIPLYSEELFELGKSFNLLTLEEIIAEISSAIYIVVESLGSACELGAFTYSNKMCKKILAIGDKKYVNDNSFINYGPLKKLLEFSDKNRVFYEEFNDGHIVFSQKLSDSLTSFIDPFRKYEVNKLRIVQNKLQIDDFGYFQLLIISIIFLLGFVKRTKLIEIIKKLYGVNEIDFKFTSLNELSQTNSESIIIDFLLEVLIEQKILIKEKNFLYVNYTWICEHAPELIDSSHSILYSDFIKTNEYLKIKSRMINLAKKEGHNLWRK